MLFLTFLKLEKHISRKLLYKILTSQMYVFLDSQIKSKDIVIFFSLNMVIFKTTTSCDH